MASTKITRGISNGFSLKDNYCLLSFELLAEANPELNLGPEQGSNLLSLLNKPLILRKPLIRVVDFPPFHVINLPPQTRMPTYTAPSSPHSGWFVTMVTEETEHV